MTMERYFEDDGVIKFGDNGFNVYHATIESPVDELNRLLDEQKRLQDTIAELEADLADAAGALRFAYKRQVGTQA